MLAHRATKHVRYVLELSQTNARAEVMELCLVMENVVAPMITIWKIEIAGNATHV